MGLAGDLARVAVAPVDLTDRMRRSVACSVFDWGGVGIAGRNEPVSRAARDAATEEGGGAAGLFAGGRATMRMAAMANGAASHALDYDDTHFLHIGHPSVAVLPAALAVAESRGSEGAALIEAAAIGLELSCRMGDWLGRGHYEAGFHQTGTAGAFGATAAAGRLMGLDAVAMERALALCSTRAAGLKSQFGTMGKPLNAGFAAEIGVSCAALARHGAGSNPEAIEGAQGFGPTHAGAARGAAWDGFGEAWVFPDVSYKFHACCHGLHAMLEAVRELREEGLDPDAVEAVRIVTHPRWLAVCNQRSPTTGLGAKFSYRLTAAMGIAGVDTAALDTFSDEITARPDLTALRDRVIVETDEGLSDMQARVRIETAGGMREAYHDLAALTDMGVIEARLREKSATLLGAGRSDALWQAVDGLDAAADARGLTRVLFDG
ncbi:MmgE/PrpD family protein [Palleronia sp. LCG004]|uniref:MmgE/PrpD family protein n=1 Tax=Palleronia sp. LCG004 TaxID=3079304 RepID=UPI002942A2F5|nr:MmgE/PrpD family protein [Palleronia sp. LCG004]WOI57808.1 MmgE/PrpD family protein [Palleronia sp. LCG004]